MAVYMTVHSPTQVQSREEMAMQLIYMLMYIQESRARYSKELHELALKYTLMHIAV